MKTSERKRIARELAADLRAGLIRNAAKMPDSWDGFHVRALAGRWRNPDGAAPGWYLDRVQKAITEETR